MILKVFGAEDSEILGLAAWAMGEVGFKAALPYVKALKGRGEPLRIYIKGDFCQKPVGQWAEEAVVKIQEYRNNTENTK
jgi:hypothetical protein